MKLEAVTEENLEQYRELIIPYIYEEFKGSEDIPESPYFGIAAFDDADAADPASVLIVQPEPTGDLNIVSIYTRPECRRRGYASALLDKALQVARQSFIWDEGETEELVVFKTLYRLPEDLQEIYEAFLIKNNFSEFYELDEDVDPDRKSEETLTDFSETGEPAGSPGHSPVCRSSSAYIRFFRDNKQLL